MFFHLWLRYISWQPALLMFFGFQTRKPFVSDLSPCSQLCQNSSCLLYRLLFLESYCRLGPPPPPSRVMFMSIIHTLKKWLFRIIVTRTSVSLSSRKWLKWDRKPPVMWLHTANDCWTWCQEKTVGTTRIFMYFRFKLPQTHRSPFPMTRTHPWLCSNSQCSASYPHELYNLYWTVILN